VAWWRVVVDAKFGSSGGDWCYRENVGAYGVGFWKNIIRGWGKVSSHTRSEVGDGANIRFWHDLRCEDMALKEAFPGLFGIMRANNAFVADHMDIPGGSINGT
jgi:hypothetical protein